MKIHSRIGYGCLLILGLCSLLSMTAKTESHPILIVSDAHHAHSEFSRTERLHAMISNLNEAIIIADMSHRRSTTNGKVAIAGFGFHTDSLQSLTESLQVYAASGFNYAPPLIAMLPDMYISPVPADRNYPTPVNDPKPDNTNAQLIRIASLSLRTLQPAFNS
jgi:hypothetical protein